MLPPALMEFADRFPGCVECCVPNPCRRIASDRREPLTRHGATESTLRGRLASAVLQASLGYNRVDKLVATNGGRARE
jgi:hypothetical protein